MASSLNRIFTKKIQSPEYGGDEMDQEDDFAGFSSGSETETISERDSGAEDEWSVKRGGVAPVPKGLQRNPTRRPNPKISNRNALLARENRRRKKEHVESLEREVDELKESNGKIRKALRKKSKLVEQLTRERNYLKSVIANRTGIMAVLKSVQRSGLPMTSSGLSYVTEPMGMARRIGSSSDEGLGASPHSILTDEEDKFNPHNDLGLSGQEVSFEEEFSRLPDVDELLSTMAYSGDRCSSGRDQVPARREFASTSFREDASPWSFALPVR